MGMLAPMDALFSVPNHSAAGAPAWTSAAREPNELRSYFENAHGEQWISSATAHRLLVSGGDLDWETKRIDVPNYKRLLRELTESRAFAGVLLNTAESMWIASVLQAADDAFGSAVLA